MVFRNIKLSNGNISEFDFDILKCLINNSDIVVFKMDKGGVVVIMDRDEYERKIIYIIMVVT